MLINNRQKMKLLPDDIHIWVADLAISPTQSEAQAALLSMDECERAKRFHSSIHKNRFIAARYALRVILSYYLDQPPQAIQFGYSTFGKPYLLDLQASSLQFNLAHSHRIAIYGITLNYPIGVDIEYIQDVFPQDVARRYFPGEYDHLMQVPVKDRVKEFFHLWTRKEAVIKAIGKGLSLSLSSFTVSLQQPSETIFLEKESWHLLSLDIHAHYLSALATNQLVKNITIHHFKIK